VEVGNEYAKLAHLLFNNQEILKCMNTIENAKIILSRYYAPDYVVLKDLDEMRKCLLDTIEKTVGPYWST
jgi:hypothetical protein